MSASEEDECAQEIIRCTTERERLISFSFGKHQTIPCDQLTFKSTLPACDSTPGAFESVTNKFEKSFFANK
jgi:hypothetical protein